MIDDPAMWPWAVALGILGTVGTVIVGIYTARSAKAANRESSQLGGWRDMVKALQEDVARLRAERAEDERRYNAELDLCNRRITGLAEKIEAAEQRERSLILWARSVVELMRSRQLEFPQPPFSIHDTGPNRVVG